MDSSPDTASACSPKTGNSSKPLRRSSLRRIAGALRKSLRPRLYLIADSQMLAVLKTRSLSELSMRERASEESRSGKAPDQISKCVSSRNLILPHKTFLQSLFETSYRNP